MEQLSAFILSKDSETHLPEILNALSTVSDEILIIESGITGKSESFAGNFEKARVIYKEFGNFRDQRTFATDCCMHDMVLFVDSDEIPDDNFLKSIHELKQSSFEHDAYTVSRKWNVLGKNVHCMYPVTSPDNPVKLFRKSRVSFSSSNLVHESPKGYRSVGRLGGSINHITMRTKEELKSKLESYTNFASHDLILKRKKVNRFNMLFSPVGAFFKWYFFRGGYKDGYIGLILGGYSYQYTLRKYLKAKKLLINDSSPSDSKSIS